MGETGHQVFDDDKQASGESSRERELLNNKPLRRSGLLSPARFRFESVGLAVAGIPERRKKVKKIVSIEERDMFIGRLCADEGTDWEAVAKDVADSAETRNVNVFDMEIMALALYMLKDIKYLRLTALGAVIR